MDRWMKGWREGAAWGMGLVLALWAWGSAAQPAPGASPEAVPLTAAQSREVVLSLAQLLRERFAFRARGKAAAREIEAMERSGVFRSAGSASELLARVEARVAPIVNDRHFRVRYWGPERTAGFNEAPPSAQELRAFHEEVRLRGGEIPEVRWLPGNVGYLRISRFMDAPPMAEKLAQAMALLADTGALIIDVRGTPGGEPAGVATVIGHLVAERTATVRTINEGDPSADRTFYAEPRAPGYIGKPVYVLTSRRTGSGAEEFAYDLQVMGRATVVGETTAGAATPGGYRPLAHGFVAFIPMQIVVNTRTGTHWEGVGVRPDLAVPAAEAEARAHRLALETILKTATGLHAEIAQEGLASLQR